MHLWAQSTGQMQTGYSRNVAPDHSFRRHPSRFNIHQESKMNRSKFFVIGFAAAALLGGTVYAADEDDKVDAAALAKALPSATVSLEQGLKAGEAKGKPISAKFE